MMAVILSNWLGDQRYFPLFRAAQRLAQAPQLLANSIVTSVLNCLNMEPE
jgi:hypothetical protein